MRDEKLKDDRQDAIRYAVESAGGVFKTAKEQAKDMMLERGVREMKVTETIKRKR